MTELWMIFWLEWYFGTKTSYFQLKLKWGIAKRHFFDCLSYSKRADLFDSKFYFSCYFSDMVEKRLFQCILVQCPYMGRSFNPYYGWKYHKHRSALTVHNIMLQSSILDAIIHEYVKKTFYQCILVQRTIYGKKSQSWKALKMSNYLIWP